MKLEFVYKYRSGVKETFDRDLTSIEKNYFWASNFKQLNDPCETLVYTDNFNIQTKFLSLFFGNTSKEHLDNVNEALKNLITRRKEIGIYSLSRTCKDELLWAHYANSHYGFCIKYDLNILLDTYKNDKMYSLPVTYSDSPPQIDIKDISDKDGLSIIKKMTCHKSKRWGYEEEHRILVDRSGEHAYNHKALKAIYFGLRMEEESKEEIMNRLKGRGIDYFQMEQISNTYRFEEKPINDINNNRLTYLTEIPPSINQLSPVKYVIIEKDYNWVIGKATIEIQLESKVHKDSIEWLAQLIKEHLFKNAKMIYMFYRIKGEPTIGICWATSHILNGKIEVSTNDFMDAK